MIMDRGLEKDMSRMENLTGNGLIGRMTLHIGRKNKELTRTGIESGSGRPTIKMAL
jgi:hypothetical protein